MEFCLGSAGLRSCLVCVRFELSLSQVQNGRSELMPDSEGMKLDGLYYYLNTVCFEPNFKNDHFHAFEPFTLHLLFRSIRGLVRVELQLTFDRVNYLLGFMATDNKKFFLKPDGAMTMSLRIKICSQSFPFVIFIFCILR